MTVKLPRAHADGMAAVVIDLIQRQPTVLRKEELMTRFQTREDPCGRSDLRFNKTTNTFANDGSECILSAGKTTDEP